GGEVLSADLLGQVEVGGGDATKKDRNAEERVHRRVVRWKADRPGIGGDPGEAKRFGVRDEDAEDAAPARRVADGRVGGGIDPRGQEALELRAGRTDDAERRVPGAGEVRGGFDEALQERVE